jgi:integrase
MSSETQPLHSRLMDAKETAEYLKLDDKTVSRWARKAYIPAHPLGDGKRKFWRFYEHELSAWLSAQSNSADQHLSPSSIGSAQVRVSETGDSQLSNARSLNLVAEPRAVVHSRLRRYQRGSLSIILHHRNTPDTWVFRYYANENGRRIYKRKTVGTILDLPRRKDAERAVAQLRIEVNEEAGVRPILLEELAVHFRTVELPLKAYSTRHGYLSVLNSCVLPRWGQCSLLSIESMEVELWIRNLKTKTGQPAAPATKSKVRNLMSALFSHAIRYGWTTRNPITPVRTTSKRQREPEILAPSEFQALLKELSEREHLMVLLAGSTGLRRGELIGLRWSDVDFEEKVVNVSRSIWHNFEGDTKTSASRKPLPLQPAVVEDLEHWRKRSPYRAPDDFLFPSIRANGKHPIEPGMVLRNHIRPALARLGIIKRIGWHSFRHGFSNLLRSNGVDLKTAQELLRHANSRVTLDIYQQSVTEERRRAQAAAFKNLIGN